MHLTVLLLLSLPRHDYSPFFLRMLLIVSSVHVVMLTALEVFGLSLAHLPGSNRNVLAGGSWKFQVLIFLGHYSRVTRAHRVMAALISISVALIQTPQPKL